VGENAKVGICVEGLFRLLWTEGVLRNAGEEFRRQIKGAVEKGIRAREEKAAGDGRRRSAGGKGVDAWAVLVDGGERMRALLGMV
jgi:hypothetical protein